MNYSQKALKFLLRAFRSKSVWKEPKEKIPSTRRRMERLGLVSLKKSATGVNIKKFRYGKYFYYVMTPKNTNYKKCIFYSHGGGYVYDITRFHWEFLIDICKRTNSKIVIPIYPLSPEHTKAEVFPWIYNLFKRISNVQENKKIILMGDSAGGGLSMALAMKARDNKATNIEATILISPWLDIKMNTMEMHEINKKDPLLDNDGLFKCGCYYLGEDEDDLISSPLHGSYEGIDNLSVFTGTMDVLNPMARVFRDNCDRQGVNVNYHEYKGSIHVFPIFRTKDGLHSRKEIAYLINL